MRDESRMPPIGTLLYPLTEATRSEQHNGLRELGDDDDDERVCCYTTRRSIRRSVTDRETDIQRQTEEIQNMWHYDSSL